MSREINGKCKEINLSCKTVFYRIFGGGCIMHLFSGVIFTSLTLSLFKFSCPHFIAFNNGTKVKSRKPRQESPYLKILIEGTTFFNSFEDAQSVCQTKGASLAQLSSPIAFNFAYRQLEEHITELSKYLLQGAAPQ